MGLTLFFLSFFLFLFFATIVNHFQVSARDNDVGLNGNIVYSIIPDVDGHYLSFAINSKNGSVMTSMSLDRENISVFYVTVKATDSSPDEQAR